MALAFALHNSALRYCIERHAYWREQLLNEDSTRDLLILAGQAAEDVSTRPPVGGIEERVMKEEREEFCRFSGALKPSDLDNFGKFSVSTCFDRKPSPVLGPGKAWNPVNMMHMVRSVRRGALIQTNGRSTGLRQVADVSVQGI
jgi:hypothetical protein